MDAFVTVQNLVKNYKFGDVTIHVLRGASFSVQSGEFVALTGPSGSGKTTLLSQIGLLDYPTSGSIAIEGVGTKDMDTRGRADLRMEKIGFVFQAFNLFSELTALENVAFPALHTKERRGEIFEKARGLLRTVGLGERISHRPFELSGGQQQRVAIARALINDPKILLADEPTGNLDSKTSEEIVDLFCELNRKSGMVVFMVTHEKDLALKADRIIEMRDGRIETNGA